MDLTFGDLSDQSYIREIPFLPIFSLNIAHNYLTTGVGYQIKALV